MEGFKSMMTDIYKQWHVLDMSCLYPSVFKMRLYAPTF